MHACMYVHSTSHTHTVHGHVCIQYVAHTYTKRVHIAHRTHTYTTCIHHIHTPCSFTKRVLSTSCALHSMKRTCMSVCSTQHLHTPTIQYTTHTDTMHTVHNTYIQHIHTPSMHEPTRYINVCVGVCTIYNTQPHKEEQTCIFGLASYCLNPNVNLQP
jgi:hypothetical protein